MRNINNFLMISMMALSSIAMAQEPNESSPKPSGEVPTESVKSTEPPKGEVAAQSPQLAPPKPTEPEKKEDPKEAMPTPTAPTKEKESPLEAKVKESGNVVVGVGKNKDKSPNYVLEKVVNNETVSVSKKSLDGRGRFVRGSEIKNPGETETVKYAYVSRGEWFMSKVQVYLDQVYLQVMKADRSYLQTGLNEAQRSFNYICLLLATDDGSPKMLSAIAKAIAIHRENVIRLQLQWTQKDEVTAKLLDEYIRFLWVRPEDFDKDKKIIPAGSLANSSYRSMEETYGSVEGE